MGRGPLVKVAFAVGCLATLTSGCGGPSSDTPSEDPRSAQSVKIPTSARLDPDTGRIVLPLDTVLPSERDQTLLLNAQDIVLKKCMSKKGHAFPALDRKYTAAPSRRYGVWTTKQAKNEGYAIPDNVTESGMAANSAKFSSEESQALRKCTADQEFRSVQPDGVMPVQQDEAAMFDEAFSSTKGQKAFSKWKKCMRDEGYTVGAPEHPLTPTGHVDKRSTSVALTDVQCKQKTHFISILSSVEAEIQTRYVEKHQVDLTKISVGVDKAVEDAKQITAS